MISLDEVREYIESRIPKARVAVEKLQTINMTVLHLSGPVLTHKSQITDEVIKASDSAALRWNAEVAVREMQEEAMSAYGIDKLIEERLEKARVDGLQEAMQCISAVKKRLSAVVLHRDVVAINTLTDLLIEIGAMTLRPASPHPYDRKVR